MSRPELVVHREKTSGLVRVGGVLTTSAARTAIDLARNYNRLDALALLDRCLQRGLDKRVLYDELDRQTGKRGYRQASELLGYADVRAESPMESRTRMRCIHAGLPMPTPQVVVWCGGVARRLDLGWEEWLIGLDFESAQFHSGADAATRDNPRHNALVLAGWQMYYATAGSVYRNPEQFIGPIRAAIELARRRSSA
ncbi:hypothetical protein [Skermania sp. ID1734]|uniref:hypothetical protein n=1 Tax=Skermania sp. ID1734 TaxID=2597516 RepID=UPI00163D87D7|nr:hypothetical protein [Skermania sp. ID1734]